LFWYIFKVHNKFSKISLLISMHLSILMKTWCVACLSTRRSFIRTVAFFISASNSSRVFFFCTLLSTCSFQQRRQKKWTKRSGNIACQIHPISEIVRNKNIYSYEHFCLQWYYHFPRHWPFFEIPCIFIINNKILLFFRFDYHIVHSL